MAELLWLNETRWAAIAPRQAARRRSQSAERKTASFPRGLAPTPSKPTSSLGSRVCAQIGADRNGDRSTPVFLTGTSGFIGSAILQEWRASGHERLGLARSDAGAEMLARQGVAVHCGTLEQPETLAAAASDSDGVIIHTAFIPNLSRFAERMETDRAAVLTSIEPLSGHSSKPMIA